MVIVYKKWKKYNEILLTKNKMDLNNQKITNHPPFPDTTYRVDIVIESSLGWKIMHLFIRADTIVKCWIISKQFLKIWLFVNIINLLEILLQKMILKFLRINEVRSHNL